MGRFDTHLVKDSASSEEGMDLDTFNVSSKGKQKCYEVDYSTLAQRDVERQMCDDIDHISGIFGVDVSLRHRFILF
jgi:ariadne-1